MAKTSKVKRPPGWMGYAKHALDTGADSPGQNNLGSGKYYGTGFKAKIGRLRTGTMLPGNPMKKAKLKTPPRSVV